MSLQNCFNRTVENCAADNRCALEYDSNLQNPACVPAVGTMFGTTLSDTDLQAVRKILIRLLPREGARITKGKFVRELNGLISDLRPRVTHKLRQLVTEQPHESWSSLISTVSNEIVLEINSECGICREQFNDPVDDLTPDEDPENDGNEFIQNACCGQLYHRRCLRNWLNRPNQNNGNSCPICPDVLLDRVTLSPTRGVVERRAVRLFNRLEEILNDHLAEVGQVVHNPRLYLFLPRRNQVMIVIEMFILSLVLERLMWDTVEIFFILNHVIHIYLYGEHVYIPPEEYFPNFAAL